MSMLSKYFAVETPRVVHGDVLVRIRENLTLGTVSWTLQFFLGVLAVGARSIA